MTATSPTAAGATPADLVFTNARIYTVTAQGWAQAAAITGNRLSYVGDDRGVTAFIGAHTRVLDLGGRLVLPGFVESHLHLLLGAASTSGVILGMEDSLDDIGAKVAAYATAHPERTAIFGASYNGLLFGELGPDRKLLDAVVPDRPVILLDHTLHSAWANSCALERAGVTAESPDPLPGRYVRDSTGRPTGAITGAPASVPVIAALNAITAESIMSAVPRIVRGLSAFGFTAALDCGNPLFTQAAFDAVLALDHAGELPLRLSLTVMANEPASAGSLIERSQQYSHQYATEHLWLDTVKIVGDSVLENQTAAMLEPYLTTGDSGYLYFEPPELHKLVSAAAGAGFGIIYHAIGDRTVRTGLDAAQALRDAGDRDTRFILTHVQMVNRVDRARFAELGVHVQTSGNWANMQTPYYAMLGAERVENDQFPFRDFVDSGANLCLGADWPATPGGFALGVNPFINIYTALHRRVPSAYRAEFGSDARVLPPAEQVLTLEQAIAGYTINGARALGRDASLGSLAVGKLADLIVLDRDLFTIDSEQIPLTEVLTTVADGRIVHDRLFGTLD